MEELSFIEKIQILFQNMLAHPLFILILLIPLAIFIFNKKLTKKSLIFSYIAIIILILFVGNTVIFELFDNMVDAVFMALYFPNFITLFIVEVLSACIMLITFIKKKITKINKIINITAFMIIQILFFLILSLIQINKIDIYRDNALYGNTDLLTLMQLMMGTFFLQIISLLVIYSVEKVTKKLDESNKPKTPIITPFTEKVRVEPVLKMEEIKSEKQKPLNKKLISTETIKEKDINEEIKRQEKQKEEKIKKLIDPLDNTLINIKKINSKNVKEELEKEEQNKIDEIINRVTPLDNTLLNIKTISSHNIKEEIIKEELENKSRIINSQKPLDTELINIETISSKNIKEDIEIEESNKKNKIKDSINPLDNTLINLNKITSKDINDEIHNDEKDKINKILNQMNPLDDTLINLETISSKEVIEEKKEVKELKEEPLELIDNLQIVDFEKTVELILKLRRVYTIK